jgi:glutamine cyclotransferase
VIIRFLPFLLLVVLLAACVTSPVETETVPAVVAGTRNGPATAVLPSVTAVQLSPTPPQSETTGQQAPGATQARPVAYPAPLVTATPVVPYPGGEQAGGPYPAGDQADSPAVYPGPATAMPTAVESNTVGDKDGEPVWTYRIVNEFPHDPLAYTQGLVFEQGFETLLESTGRESSLRRVDLETGELEQRLDLPSQYFGEGLTLFNDRIVQLTWKEQVGFVYDAETFERIGSFSYPHEGWGLTHDDARLIVSDGTDVIRFWDPATFQETGRIRVKSLAGPVTMLNELEYVNGEIWANVWYSDFIVRISPEDGRVLGWIDLSGIISPDLRTDPNSILNGIAYDPQSGRLFVTGKNWPTLFEIEIVKPDEMFSQ